MSTTDKSTSGHSEQPGRDASPPPPPPWRLRGRALLRLEAVPISRVRPLVPSELAIVPCFPGRTLAGLLLADYDSASTLQYHELIAFPALVRKQGWHPDSIRPGAWISHIRVDSPLSQAGGQQYWGLNKGRAEFLWEEDSGMKTDRIQVRAESRTLCSVSGERGRHQVRAPLFAPVWSALPERMGWFSGRGSALVSRASATVQIPPDSPLSAIGFSSGPAWRFTDLDLQMRQP